MYLSQKGLSKTDDLFELDRRLSNALWLWTALFAVPWFLILIPLLPRL